ncbi:hypothetical protein GCM10010840_25490 [Deinococcus aerolatus]|uniref:GGDEF domain-containing protein n=1 Tax=Deinococcus aerolatus TaxID=522487 RepID=A0ABQ2GD74_9DEIO|nr:GGDEF domain-containing protein [Deinococcus aerolatus]GGL86408.1 hypothetical protein GCM10010840_25490 [Deinococcus aerolatus]
MERLVQELMRVERNSAHLAVMFVDLDDFKCVNDSLGYAAGDAVLREIAERMQRALRPRETIARVGGDEFVVVAADLQGAPHAARVARQVQEAVMRPICVAGEEVTVGCSVGISLSSQDGTQADDLLRLADLAMYEIKKEGKSAVHFYSPNRPSQT